MSTYKDQTMPEGKWEFNSEVVDVFDEMLQRSIPQYQVMRQLVTTLAKNYLVPHTALLDLGCSRGDAMIGIMDNVNYRDAGNMFFGVDCSHPMLAAARRRMEQEGRDEYAQVSFCDLRHHFPAFSLNPHTSSPMDFSVILSILTIQFIPIEYRQSILRKIWKSLPIGGAFIFVEKVIGSDAEMDELIKNSYWENKLAHGYTQEQVDRKALSLEGVLVPVTAKMNEELLAKAGFSHIECTWRYLNFAMWLAVKE